MIPLYRSSYAGIFVLLTVFLASVLLASTHAQEARFREFFESTQLPRLTQVEPIESISTTPSPLESDLVDLRQFESQMDPSLSASEEKYRRSQTFYERLLVDQRNFYSGESMSMLAGGLMVGAAVANSTLDEGIHKHFQSSVRRASSDDWFNSLHASKELGDGFYTLPIFVTAWGTGAMFPESPYAMAGSRWGEKSIRGFLLGAPSVIVLQRITGGSRPDEIPQGSEWRAFRDNNGISGHAFMGSLPFITAAKMTKNPAGKAIFYAGSTIAPLSRVNDSAHYSSQVALGWWLAFLAASAVDATDDPKSKWRFLPYMTSDGSGLALEYRF